MMQLKIMTKKMDLAILIEDEEILLWQCRVLENIISSDIADIKFYILDGVGVSEENFDKLSLIYKIHDKTDRYIFRNSIDFDKKVNIIQRFKTIPVVRLTYMKSGKGTLQTDDQNTLDNKPDLLLNFGISITNSAILKEFKAGILTYHISSQMTKTSAPTCYWEVIKRKPEVEASIHLTLPDLQDEIEIFRTGILPYPNSINLNRNNLYELASILIPRTIGRISVYGNDFTEIMKRKSATNYIVPQEPEFFQPSSLHALSNLILLQVNFLVKKIKYHKIGRWFLMFKLHEQEHSFPNDLESFTLLKAPKNKFWADPFVISKDNYHYIFIEEYLFRPDKGHISVLKLDEKGKTVCIEPIIEKPYHMSYPFIFKHEEFYYMVPETGSNKTIELYRCTDFPAKWEFVKNIMENITAKDTTLFFHKNKWWLFTSVIVMNNATVSYNELFLFYSDDLFSSNWQSHPMNPIVNDHKLSRPAGRIFIRDNKIFRPSQDCSGIYGRALNLNCITKLSETDYEEVSISKIEPIWSKNIKGIHTHNSSNKISVIDAFSFRNRFTN